MYSQVLLCYDGTAEGRNALKEGAEVALAMGCHAHLLAILRETPMAVPEGFSASYFEGEERAVRTILDEGVEWLRARGLAAEGHICFGSPIDQIPAAARRLKADLIVLGHRHRSRLARWWSDSEDAALLEKAPCSILVAVVPGTAGAP